jgi:hypothetical protein
MKRVVLLSLGALALAGAGWLALSSGGCLLRMPGPSDPVSLQPRALATAQQGTPIVTAVYEFKNRCGLWPCSLYELVPDYLPEEAGRGWHYEWKPSGWWHLTNYIDFPYWAVRYERRKDEEGWQLTDGMDGIDLNVQQSKPIARVIPQEELLNNLRAEMGRRMAAEPKRMLHYQGQVSWHYRRNELEEARAVCMRCLEVWPDHWWPNLMLSILDAQLGAFEQADLRFTRFTEQKADFNHFFLLAQFYLTQGQTERAFGALKQAATRPMGDLTDDMYTSDQPLGMMAYQGPWKAAVMAYRAKRYDVATAICDRWERYRIEKSPSADASFFAIRAACYLALGHFDQADEQIAEANRVRRSNRQLAKNVDQLSTAIERRDSSFVYDPGEGAAFTVLIEYE